MKQLKIFQVEEPAWSEITIDWLFEYLQTEYPEMKFELLTYANGSNEIRQTFTKKARCSFSINKDADLTIWKNSVLVHLGVQKTYGNYCGMGEAVNSMDKFKERLPIYINSCKEHAANYNKAKAGE